MKVNMQLLLIMLLVVSSLTNITVINAEAKTKNWIKLTETEKQYLCRVVETETYGGTYESKCNVASVVINRYYSKQFKGSVVKIITARNQFSYSKTKISKKTKKAVNYVIKNGDTANGALFFHSGRKSNRFFGASYVFTDNVGHHFYK